MGPVFRAFDPENDRAVAVKLFTVDLAPELAHQFVADLDRLVAAELTHPSIARPIASGILGNSPYLVEEFVEGESLDIALRVHGPAPVPDALRIATQIAGALDFAAVSHVHHGALHPRDVLLTGQEARLTGIGVARALEQVGMTAPTRRPYAAPERISGGVWHRFADIFSLAALMYELLWGRRLNGVGVQAVATLEPITGGDLTALSLAFSRALAEDPGGRYSRALKFVEALKNAFPGDSDTDGIRSSHAFPPADDVDQPAPIPDEPVIYVEPPPPTPRQPLVDTVVLTPLERAVRIEASVPVQPPPPMPVEAPQADLVLQPEAAELDLAVEPTVVAAPQESAPAPPSAVATYAPQPESEQPRASTLPFDVGPRRRDRARYVPPPDEVQVDEASDDDPTPAATDVLPPSMLERSRSGLWPLGLALVIGIGMGVGIGFGSGYWTAFRDRGGAVAPAAGGDAAQAVAASPAPQAREYTDSAVPESPKPAATAATSAPVPAAATPPATFAAKPRAPETESRAPGRILVRSTPSGARVAVDGRDLGATPLAVRDLAVGTHTVRVTRDGYVPQERAVRVTRSRPSPSMVVTLERSRATAAANFNGGLTVDSRPSGAKVYIDGRLAGTTPLQSSVAAGEHAIRLERDGYRRWTSGVRIVSNEQNRVTASLER